MSDRRPLTFIFVDGLGLGSDADSVNPLVVETYPALSRLCGGRLTMSGMDVGAGPTALVRAIDATLGVEGLPQSGTGQATIFTGVNCAERAGRHYGPFPHSTSKSVIAKKNLFKRVVEGGWKAQFANPYPARFFSYVERTNRWTVTTLCCLEAGIPLKSGADLKRGLAVAADLTGESWPEPGDRITPVSPREAGRRLAGIAARSDFTLFEYFATDKAGHSRDMDRAVRTLRKLDDFVGGLLESTDLGRRSILLTSDHGNIEDMSTKTHTRNPVPLIVRGPAASSFSDVADLTGVTPAIVRALGTESD